MRVILNLPSWCIPALRKLAHRRSGQRGQSMVEFALIAPTALFVLFMIIEGALFINAQATIDNAAREAARIAAMCGGSITQPGPTYNGVSSTDCTGAVQSATTRNLGLLRYVGTINPDVLVCSPPPPSGPCVAATYNPTQGSLIQVTVIYRYDYYFGALINPSPFATNIESDAIVVSQQ